MALFKCSECGKEISDKAAFCPHCGCPVVQTVATYNDSSKMNVPSITERKSKGLKKRNKVFPVIIVGSVIVIAILAILISGLLSGEKSSVVSDGIDNAIDGRITGGTETELAMIIDILYSDRKKVVSVFTDAKIEGTVITIPGTFAGSTGIYKAILASDESDIYKVIFERDCDEYDSDAVVDEICDYLGDYSLYDAEWNEYEWETDDLELRFYVDERVYFYETSSSSTDGKADENNAPDSSNKLTLTANSVDELFASFQVILSSVDYDDVINSFPAASTADSGSLIIDG